MKSVAISQSNYIPWKGYFDLINQVDCFVLYDDAQYTRRDWRNRNKIKTPTGEKWLSIPVEVKGKYHQSIRETRVVDGSWANQHWEALRQNYAEAPYCQQYEARFSALYERASQMEYLSEINALFLGEICSLLGIGTPLRWSSDFELNGDATEKLLHICQQLEATDYYSGPAAANYMDVPLFDNAGITMHWVDYSGYPTYSQCHGEFSHGVTILDLLFNCGESARQHMKSFTEDDQ